MGTGSDDKDAKGGAGGPTPEGEEDKPRFGTKADVRETESKGGGGAESEPEDRPRDGS
jgi:hypothetical protein